MRDIKFRAWNKDKKIMIYKNEDNSSDYWDGVCASVIELINNELNSEFNKKEYEFMQYTGLKDKNGKEIYEGDIVKINDEIIAKVIWDNDYLGYFLYANDENSIEYFENGEQPLYDYWGSIEIIGNAYDNPDLLEKGVEDE